MSGGSTAVQRLISPAVGTLGRRRGGCRLIMLIVGFDDVLHEFVTDYVAFIEVDKLNAFDVAQNIADLDQA